MNEEKIWNKRVQTGEERLKTSLAVLNEYTNVLQYLE